MDGIRLARRLHLLIEWAQSLQDGCHFVLRYTLMRFLHFSVSLVEHGLVTLLSFILFVLLCLLINIPMQILSPVKQAVENFSLSDLYYQMDWMTTDSSSQSDEVVIVDVSPLRERKEIARVLEQVDSCAPAAVGVDLIFAGAHKNSTADDSLAAVALRMQNAVFSCRMSGYAEEDEQYEEKQSSFFVSQHPEMALREGYANAVGEAYSTCLRELSIERKCEGVQLPSLTAAVAETYLHDSIPIQRDQNYFIDFRHIDFRIIPYDSVMQYADKIKDCIVLIGLADKGEDQHITPIGVKAGVVVQAYAVQTLIDHQGVRSFGGVWYWLMIGLVIFLTAFWQYEWIRCCRQRKNLFLYFLSETPLTIVTFFWLALLAYITYVFYNVENIYISMSYVLVVVVLVDEARDIYIALLKTLERSEHRHRCIIYAIKKSAYLNNLE